MSMNGRSQSINNRRDKYLRSYLRRSIRNKKIYVNWKSIYKRNIWKN